jgi:hypothetical protein
MPDYEKKTLAKGSQTLAKGRKTPAKASVFSVRPSNLFAWPNYVRGGLVEFLPRFDQFVCVVGKI